MKNEEKQISILLHQPPKPTTARQKSLYGYQVSNDAQSEMHDICICESLTQRTKQYSMSGMDNLYLKRCVSKVHRT